MRRYSGLRKQRLLAKYGLACCRPTGRAAWSGLTRVIRAPFAADHSPMRRRSARSPMPQLAWDRLAYSWAAHPQASRSSGRKQRPGLTIRSFSAPSSATKRW